MRQLTALMPDAQVLMLTVFEDTDKIFARWRRGERLFVEAVVAEKLLEAIEEVRDGGRRCRLPSRARSHSFKAAPPQGDESVDLSPRELAVLERAGGRVGLQSRSRISLA